MKNRGQWGARVAYAGMIALIVAAFVWFAHNALVEASLFFILAAAYAFFLFRVVARSDRATTVMHFAFVLISYSLLSVENDLGIPMAGPWVLGFIAGAIAGGYTWSGKRAGSEIRRKRERTGEDGKGFTGGLRLALINAACAVVLLGAGVLHLVFQSPTVAVGAVLAGALLGGWALFRFPPSLEIRNALLLVIPVEFFLLIFVGGNSGQMALPFVWAFGALAGILIGGRYWSGPRFGEPRPPFNFQAKRRRKRKRRPSSKQRQNQTQKH